MSNLIPIEHKSQMVLTTQQLADVYETETNNIVNNFARNKERFTEGVHYFLLKGIELQALKNYITDSDLVPRNAPHFYLWTEKGASRHCKILDNDKAWQRFDELEDTYFRSKLLSIDVSKLSPELQMFNQMFQAMAKNQLMIEETKSMAQEAKTGLEKAKEVIENIKDTMAELPKDQWRDWVTRSMNEIVKVKCFKHDDIRNESYKLLEEKAGADLAARVRNGRRRLEDSGATKTVINTYCKLDAVEEDKRLKEIYSGIVKELRIKYLV